jgi:hypothetical protein
MSRRVPVVATWLLERFGVKRQNEALMGDLAEEYQAGKSWGWYWWQTLVAIGVAVVRDVRGHKLLALRAVAMAWALGRAFSWLRQKALITFVLASHNFHGSPPYYFHTSRWLQIVLSGESVLVSLLVGWLVARAHRTHAAAMVLMVAASRPFIAVSFDIYYSLAGFHILQTYRVHPEYIFVTLLNMALGMVLIVAGGLLVRPKALSSTMTAGPTLP